MDINKNSYTFGFAAIIVIIVSCLLSGAAILLKDPQERNMESEKKQNILNSVSIKVSREQAEKEYSIYIKEQLVLNYLGETQEGSAFDVDLAKEIKKDISEQKLPLYIAKVEGEKIYIIPLRGKGLWGPIWGFISFNDDLNTVFAAVFDHKKETPGLGAEINKDFFQDSLKGKTIMEEGEFVSIIVQKGGSNGDIHKVDAISGGTITSDGVTKMIEERLKRYMPYFKEEFNKNKERKKQEEVKAMIEIVTTDEMRDTTSNISDRIID